MKIKEFNEVELLMIEYRRKKFQYMQINKGKNSNYLELLNIAKERMLELDLAPLQKQINQLLKKELKELTLKLIEKGIEMEIENEEEN